MNVWNCIINKDGKLISTPSSATEVTASRSVALGYFDGIHMGHQKIFSTMLEQAHKYGKDAHLYRIWVSMIFLHSRLMTECGG